MTLYNKRSGRRGCNYAAWDEDSTRAAAANAAPAADPGGRARGTVGKGAAQQSLRAGWGASPATADL